MVWNEPCYTDTQDRTSYYHHAGTDEVINKNVNPFEPRYSQNSVFFTPMACGSEGLTWYNLANSKTFVESIGCRRFEPGQTRSVSVQIFTVSFHQAPALAPTILIPRTSYMNARLS